MPKICNPTCSQEECCQLSKAKDHSVSFFEQIILFYGPFFIVCLLSHDRYDINDNSIGDDNNDDNNSYLIIEIMITR